MIKEWLSHPTDVRKNASGIKTFIFKPYNDETSTSIPSHAYFSMRKLQLALEQARATQRI